MCFKIKQMINLIKISMIKHFSELNTNYFHFFWKGDDRKMFKNTKRVKKQKKNSLIQFHLNGIRKYQNLREGTNSNVGIKMFQVTILWSKTNGRKNVIRNIKRFHLFYKNETKLL